MGRTPQHPDNPCRDSLPEAEQVPAKIWELLRRNEKFKRTVARFQELDRRLHETNSAIRTLLDQGAQFGEAGERGIRLDALRDKRDLAGSQTSRLLEAVKARHPFAGCALEWLVPEPLFIVRKVGLPEGFNVEGKSCAPHETITYGEGITPDPRDRKHWRWRRRHPGKPDTGGGLMRRGPRVEWRTSAFPPFRSPVNPIAEWASYQRDHHGPFSLADSWNNAPSHFKRIFCAIWRHFDNRAKDAAGMRFDAPNEHEVDFFRGWRLGDQLAQATQQGSLVGDDVVHSLQFDNLARNYRVFAFPKAIRTRSEARRLSKWLLNELSASLPKHEAPVLGAPLDWDMLLTYDDRRFKGDEHLAAMRYTFDNLYLRLPAARRLAAKPTERTLDSVLRHKVAKKALVEGESTRWHSWLDDFARIHAPNSSTGLVQLIFPRLEPAFAVPPKRQSKKRSFK